MPEPVRVELLSRDGCTLCDKARVLLGILSREQPLDIKVVDIDAEAALRLRYDQRIPVVRVGEVELCEGKVTLSELRQALTAVSAQ